MSYTDEELINLYKEVKDKNKQIKILADLKCCDVKEILEMLQENGLISGVKKKSERGKWTPERLGELQHFLNEGLCYRDIGERMGENERCITNAVSNYKLKKNMIKQDIKRAPEESGAGERAKRVPPTGHPDGANSVHRDEACANSARAIRETPLQYNNGSGMKDKVAETFGKLDALQKKCIMLWNACEDAECCIKSIADLARLGMEAMEVAEDPAGTMFEILNFIVMKCNDLKVMMKKEKPPLDCGNPSGGKMI